MIQLLATKCHKLIAYFLLIVFECSFISARNNSELVKSASVNFHTSKNHFANTLLNKSNLRQSVGIPHIKSSSKETGIVNKKPFIGGPSQPEMSSFKSVGTDNMVNLFTGDFNYNIPLLDVGGYPINIFYDGNVTPEQEASWVGLGWNINPGTVNRNMRGIPDDFNGEELLEQKQKVKDNNTWGFNVGYDLELFGIDVLKDIAKGSVGLSLGYSYNNYLGPAIDFGVHGTTNIALAGKVSSEKNLMLGAGIGANVNSRSGLTISPNLSLTANTFASVKGLSTGVGLSTSYNSRVGIKQLQINEQMSFNKSSASSHADSYFRGRAGNILSTPITFSKPSYIPAIRMPVTNQSYAGRYEGGTGMFGVKGSIEGDVYIQKSSISSEDITQTKRMVGYLHYEEANDKSDVVMDFTRFNDNEVMPKTPIISVPQYAYDVFSIQGEGTGGSIRAYRNDIGYVRDITTRSKDKSFAAGVDFGPAGHFGANFNQVKTPTYIGDWDNGNRLKKALKFKPADGTYENVYFRNPAETNVLTENQFESIGGADLVRFQLSGTLANPTVEPILERFSKANTPNGTVNNVSAVSSEREKRTQVTSFLTATQAKSIGLDAKIKSYSVGSFLGNGNILQPNYIERDAGYRKGHHISQINVTEANGRRYVYGIPVYNTTQVDYSFSVADQDKDADLANVNSTDIATDNTNTYLKPDSKGKDGFVQITTTPAYASSFLISGLLSPDYVDVKGDGVTEDDLGDAVKFNYSFIGLHKWRTPLINQAYKANFNGGHRTEVKDDKGLITYGEREAWYLHSVESKTMIAFFTLENREDGKGPQDVLGGVDANDNSQKRLKKIDLYSKPDLKKNGLAKAKPIKTVWFEYSYILCPGTPDNASGNGKLTLEGIYFTFNGTTRTKKNKYVFSYTKNGSGNPSYALNSSDRWGTYKPKSNNPLYTKADGSSDNLKNAVYPYSKQDKNVADVNAGSWALKTVLLPSGGQIDVEYESDDYAFVQNKRAAVMMQVLGLGKTNNKNNASNSLYSYNDTKKEYVDNKYVFIKVPDANGDIKAKYLQGLEQLAFKLSVNMPKGDEYITCYANVDGDVLDVSYGKADNTTIWVKLKTISFKQNDENTPLTLAALDYLREQLPGQAFPGYDVSSTTGLKQISQMLKGMADAVSGAFQDILKYFRDLHKAKTINLDRSFMRLNEPTGHKYGGGQRVKSVKLKDNWNEMTGHQSATATYGQEYIYTTTEIFNGVERTISSGVASYEPSIGGEENPFQNIVLVTNQLPFGPASIGSIEMPVLDAFFPAPLVGYSKVTVKSINKDYINPATHKSRSGIGKQVTEFYTAKDFPVMYQHTPLQAGVSDKVYHKASPFNFFYKYAIDSRAISQGFVVETNDMHGKLKSQSSYAEGDDKTPINYTENFYKNTGKSGIEDFQFVYGSENGLVKNGKMGVDIELMTDVREFSVKSKSTDFQGQVDEVVPPFGWPFFGWATYANSEDFYRAVTTTKVINYHSVVESVVVVDKGSKVTTKNLVFDSETGNVVVSQTINEFEKPVYNVNYPAYWAYSGMGLAYKNIDAVFTGVNFIDGKIIGGNIDLSKLPQIFESGDEIYIIDPGGTAGCSASVVSSTDVRLIWAMDKLKNASSLTNTAPDFIFIDKNGKPYTRSTVAFKIVRSGKRNMLDASATSITLMANPIDLATGKLRLDSTSKVINTTALEYKEKWQADADAFDRYKMVSFSNTPVELTTNGDFTSGNAGFLSDYTYSPADGSSAPGRYRVSTTSHNWYQNFASCIASGLPLAGNFLQVDGKQNAPASSNRIWYQAVNVEPNKNYYFSTYITSINENLYASNVGAISFSVNGVELQPSFSAELSPCTWKQVGAMWNSGSATVATIAIISKGTGFGGNDFALDNISFQEETLCSNSEIADCNGYLEKQINPYQKGLIGNFKPYRSMVFYGERTEKVPTAATNLVQNGFLKNFNPYWNFNVSSNLVPDLTNNKWVWNNQTTRFNSKGMELETKDALNIYTAAQYGYHKTLPVAIANNARYNEMFAEGFEDAAFNETLNGVPLDTCKNKHVNFGNIYNANVVGITAHTGQSVLAVSSQSAYDLDIPVNNPISEDFDLNYVTEPIGSLYNQGVNVDAVYNTGQAFNGSVTDQEYVQQNIVYNNSGSTGMGYSLVTYPVVICDPQASYWKTIAGASVRIEGSQYIDVNNCGDYLINFFAESVSEYHGEIIGFIMQFDLEVKDLDGNSIKTFHFYSSEQDRDLTWGDLKTIHLDKKIYKFSWSTQLTMDARSTNADYCSSAGYHGGYGEYLKVAASFFLGWPAGSASLGYQAPVSYKTLDRMNTCSATKPIAANETMIHPGFTIPAGKKMLFSGWVKQNCNSCSNKVAIDFGNGNTSNVDFVPSGPVIEGWQRIEKEFIVPDNVTTAKLKFINNSTSNIYFDDIRIHPFNANMKSYVYDPVNLRLTAELDANNYATFYEYDAEGTLIRTKVETKEGIKTINETRSFKQEKIATIQ